tara:strand:+ start:1265 stop:2620 length:1356 start_codon:yes stop_codon:yes gene_type:complete
MINVQNNYLIKKIIEKKNSKILFYNNKYYYGEDLLKNIEFWIRKISKLKIKKSSLVAFESEYSLDAISFFIACLSKNLIVVNLPRKDNNLLDIVKCNLYVDIKNKKFINRKKNFTKKNLILKSYQKKKKSGLIIFSSGSTGEPKAILHDFSKLINKFKLERTGFASILMLGFDHIGGINTLLGSLIYPKGIAISVSKKDPETICKLIQKSKAELLPTTPTFLNMLIISKFYKKFDLNSLKIITFGAEFMPKNLFIKLKKIFKKIRFKQTYGLSEFGIMRSKDKNNKSLSIKVGGEDYKTKIINNFLYVKSKTNMVGYLNYKQPFKNGWLNTGDKVEKSKDGYIRILGRESDIINIGGEKVFPQEIEEVLKRLKNVADARVYSKRHDLFGEYIIANVIIDSKLKKFSEDKLKSHCKRYLAKYKIPSKFEITNYKEIVTDRLKKIRIKSEIRK